MMRWVLLTMLLVLTLGCKGSESVLGVAPSPLPPPAAAPPPASPPTPPVTLDTLPTGCWWRGGFVCGFPDAPACRFAPGYQWDTIEAYCADHPTEANCES